VQITLIYHRVTHRLEACATGFFSFEADLSSFKPFSQRSQLETSAKISRYTGGPNPGKKSGGTGFQPVQKTLIYQRVTHRLEASATGFFSFEADLSSLKPFSQRSQLGMSPSGMVSPTLSGDGLFISDNQFFLKKLPRPPCFFP